MTRKMDDFKCSTQDFRYSCICRTNHNIDNEDNHLACHRHQKHDTDIIVRHRQNYHCCLPLYLIVYIVLFIMLSGTLAVSIDEIQPPDTNDSLALWNDSLGLNGTDFNLPLTKDENTTDLNSIVPVLQPEVQKIGKNMNISFCYDMEMEL